MKKLLAFLMILLLLTPAALAEFDLAALRADTELYALEIPGSVDVVYRPVNQPYLGQVDEGFDGELVAYVDYLALVDEDATVLRLMIASVVYDAALNADQLRLTVQGKTYTFDVTHEESEYDGVYMEDYTTCLVGDGLAMLKTIAQQKKDDPIHVELLSLGETMFSGLVIIPGEEAARLYDRWIDLGGKKQNLKLLEEVWPCKVEKVK